MIILTFTEFKILFDSGKLVPGQSYKISDLQK